MLNVLGWMKCGETPEVWQNFETNASIPLPNSNVKFEGKNSSRSYEVQLWSLRKRIDFKPHSTAYFTTFPYQQCFLGSLPNEPIKSDINHKSPSHNQASSLNRLDSLIPESQDHPSEIQAKNSLLWRPETCVHTNHMIRLCRSVYPLFKMGYGFG